VTDKERNSWATSRLRACAPALVREHLQEACFPSAAAVNSILGFFFRSAEASLPKPTIFSAPPIQTLASFGWLRVGWRCDRLGRRALVLFGI